MRSNFTSSSGHCLSDGSGLFDLYYHTTSREARNMHEEELHIKYWSWCVRRFSLFDFHYDATRHVYDP